MESLGVRRAIENRPAGGGYAWVSSDISCRPMETSFSSRRLTIWMPAILVAMLAVAVGEKAFAADAQGPFSSEALKLLQEGNQRFVSQSAIHPNQTQERRKQMEQGQKPFAAVLSCSDSRVTPEILFDRGIGDLFVIRVAGNVAGADEIGTLEYGVEHLHTPLIVILGHTRCGAVTAAATHAEVSGKLAELVQKISPAVTKLETENPSLVGDAKIVADIEANVRSTIETVLAQSSVLRHAVDEKKVEVLGAIYDISTGTVSWLDRPELISPPS